jgi:hypothetical protein
VSIEQRGYIAYGVQVSPPDSMAPWEFAALKPPQAAVTPMNAGAYDENDFFLVIRDTWKDVKPGNPMLVMPYTASDEPHITWDAMLVATAEELKLSPLCEPGWFFVIDEV